MCTRPGAARGGPAGKWLSDEHFGGQAAMLSEGGELGAFTHMGLAAAQTWTSPPQWVSLNAFVGRGCVTLGGLLPFPGSVSSLQNKELPVHGGPSPRAQPRKAGLSRQKLPAAQNSKVASVLRREPAERWAEDEHTGLHLSSLCGSHDCPQILYFMCCLI